MWVEKVCGVRVGGEGGMTERVIGYIEEGGLMVC